MAGQLPQSGEAPVMELRLPSISHEPDVHLLARVLAADVVQHVEPACPVGLSVLASGPQEGQDVIIICQLIFTMVVGDTHVWAKSTRRPCKAQIMGCTYGDRYGDRNLRVADATLRVVGQH